LAAPFEPDLDHGLHHIIGQIEDPGAGVGPERIGFALRLLLFARRNRSVRSLVGCKLALHDDAVIRGLLQV